MTNKNTQNINQDNTTTFDFETFVEIMTLNEGNRRAALSFMADLYNFFYWEQVLLAQRDLKESYITQFIETNRDDVLEKESYVRNHMYYHGLKALRTVISLNTRGRQQTEKCFILKRIKRDEEGLYDLSEAKEVFHDFEQQFNAHYNPQNIPDENFTDKKWYYRK